MKNFLIFSFVFLFTVFVSAKEKAQNSDEEKETTIKKENAESTSDSAEKEKKEAITQPQLSTPEQNATQTSPSETGSIKPDVKSDRSEETKSKKSPKKDKAKALTQTETPPEKQEAKNSEPEKTEKKPDTDVKEKKKFVKGEISNIGSKDIIYPYNSVGVGLGLTKIDQVYYLTLNPKFILNKKGFLLGLHLPFNIELFNTDVSGDSLDQNFTLRSEDFDEWQDYLRVLKYFQYGRSEDKFFASFGSNFSQSIGHGTIMRRFVPNNFDTTTSTISGKVNYYNDYGGFESVLGDVANFNMPGFLVFVKPLSFFMDGYRAKSLSFGYTFVADRNAPTKLKYYDKYIDMPDPNNNPDEWDRINNTYYGGERNRRIASNDDFEDRPKILEEEAIVVQGIDAEFKVYKNEKIDIKTFVDYSWFGSEASRGGFTMGVLGRFNLDDDKEHAMRTQVEVRFYDDSYIPGFFDMFYGVERFEMLTNIYGVDNFKPDGRSKRYHLNNDSVGDTLMSFYAEATYSYIDFLALSVGYEKLPGKAFSLFGHCELPDLWIFKGMFSYYQRGITGFGEVFNNDAVSSLFRGVVRIELLPILFINGYVEKQWSFWREDKPRKDDNLQGHFLSVYDFGFDIEIGWEWDSDRKESDKDKD